MCVSQRTYYSMRTTKNSILKTLKIYLKAHYRKIARKKAQTVHSCSSKGTNFSCICSLPKKRFRSPTIIGQNNGVQPLASIDRAMFNAMKYPIAESIHNNEYIQIISNNDDRPPPGQKKR